jgi:hypothetical protein
MNKYTAAASAAVLSASTIVFGPPATAEPPWVMPDMKGMTLENAEETFSEATEGTLTLELFNAAGNTVVYNKTNWDICNQSPAAGTSLTAESWAGVGINRPNECP